MLDTFLATCRQAPDASCKLADLIRAFRASSPEAARWSRARILIEIGKRFPVGMRHGILHVGGISLNSQESWQVSPTGELVLA
jgi:hypothetical protein